MRLMSFAMTTLPFYRREKTETRRLGWLDLDSGELLCGVEKAQGLQKGESIVRLAIIRVEDVKREPLNRITRASVEREGFLFMEPCEFVELFCQSHGISMPSTVITRIRFSYVPGGRFEVAGICRQCGCVQDEACWSDEYGACWWVEDSLCSHCEMGLPADPLDRMVSAEMESRP